MKQLNRRVWIGAAAVVAIAAGIWIQRYYSGETPAPKLETQAADRGPIDARITATGTLAPLKSVLVGSQVSGRIAEVHADFNSEVKQGQVIARLDPQLFTAAVQQAKANLSGARADLQRAQALARDATRQRDRAQSLAGRKLVAQSEADTAESGAEAAAAQVISARGEVERASAALSQAELNLSYTTIHSPIDGVVISRDVDVGQTVAASLQAPTLFTIAEDLRKMQVNASISESDVGKVAHGMRATFTVDAFPNKRFEGVVREVRNAPKTVQNVVTYDAIIDVANPELELRPGMTANVTIVHGAREDALRVPNAALRFRAPADWLAKMRGDGAPGRERGAHGGGVAGQGAAKPEAGASAATAGAEATPTAGAGAGAGEPRRRRGAPDGERGAGGDGGEVAAGASGAGAGESWRERRGRLRAEDVPPDRKLVWKLDGGEPRPVRIRVGLTDGTVTEVLEGELAPGDALVTEIVGATPAAQGGGPGGTGGGRSGRSGGGGRRFGPL
jgi:HlyD family secretion protein